MTEIRKTACPLDCPDTCSIVATLENGMITELAGDPHHPPTAGFLCRKMRHYHRRIYGADRLLYPQVRIGAKGEGRFQRIGWEEAWGRLVERLSAIREQYGGEALLPYAYAGNMGLINRFAGFPFFSRYGATRLDQTICSTAVSKAWELHCGDRPGTDPEQARKADLIVAWGINVKNTNVHFWPVIQGCRKAGGQLVVIDPYRNNTAAAADRFYPVFPGGDTALALGALKAILAAKKENQAFIQSQTTGFEALARYLRQTSWDDLVRVSGLTRAQIEGFANRLTESPRTFFRIGIGLSRHTRGAMAVRAILCLALALGLFGKADGSGVLLSSRAFVGEKDRLTHPVDDENTRRQINMVQLGMALTRLEPPIRSLFVYNSNPLSVAPDTTVVRRGLAREDLFTVVHEQVMTPTARYADLLLPATTAFENSDLYTAYGHFYLNRTEPVISPRGEAISNFTLFQTLGLKMGYDDPVFQQTVADRIRCYLQDLKGLPEEFRKEGLLPGKAVQSVFASNRVGATPENEAKLRFTIDTAEAGACPFPRLMPLDEFEDPDRLSRYPLRLITPPAVKMLNSTFGECYRGEIGSLLIHPSDAADRTIVSGDRVRIVNGRGAAIRRAQVTTAARQGVVVAEGLYWECAESEWQGINDLTSQKTTDLGGGSTFHESLVEVLPLEG
jgi:anaerobic selenocysteine-containing dehydrogenase